LKEDVDKEGFTRVQSKRKPSKKHCKSPTNNENNFQALATEIEERKDPQTHKEREEALPKTKEV
jgi:hypothetical protein